MFLHPLHNFLLIRALLVLQISIISMLAVAFSLELFALAMPCSLCIVQRLILLSILLSSLIYSHKWLISILLLANIAVSFYQLLLQYHVLQTTCSINYNQPSFSSCNLINFSVLGISLVGYSMIAYIILILFVYIYLNKVKKIMP